MIVTIVHVWVKAEFVDAFIDASRENHLQSILENGNFRFDVLQDAEDPSKFVLYEAYESEAFSAAHKETSHYKKWKDAVAPWMMKPREGVKHKMLFPKPSMLEDEGV
jgi:(4S)-4-hydroxy-5-phosphonooxypentane-2,3-dione isomerase